MKTLNIIAPVANLELTEKLWEIWQQQADQRIFTTPLSFDGKEPVAAYVGSCVVTRADVLLLAKPLAALCILRSRALFMNQQFPCTREAFCDQYATWRISDPDVPMGEFIHRFGYVSVVP